VGGQGIAARGRPPAKELERQPARRVAVSLRRGHLTFVEVSSMRRVSGAPPETSRRKA
jgi:hypothetical protein